ncbi:MAG: toxic anion resistance protein [Clostridia bacterium]|nr:toxic anion resistance protein [Clostridia bacterium]
MSEEIKLTLEPENQAAAVFPDGSTEAAQAAAQKARDEAAVVLNESVLSEEEQKMVDEFAKQIDVTNSNQVLMYGSAAQQKVSNFSEAALKSVRTKDLGEIGNDITNLIGQLKGFDDDEEKKGLFGFFKKTGNKISALKTKYDKAEVSVNSIVNTLENHQVTLMKDIALFDKMYDNNLVYFKELSLYIIAGKKKLEQVRATELKELIDKAAQSGLPEDAQKANDMGALCDSFEKKLHDLELTRMVSIQMGPQIRLLQNNDKLMAEKIQSTIVNTIPLWKSQMVLSLGLAHSQQAMEAQHEVTNMTNELLRKNADTLKMGTIAAAKESERGVVDIETLQHTNETLIQTLDEVLTIQNEGREKRRAAEAELGRIEGELRQKLLEIHQN